MNETFVYMGIDTSCYTTSVALVGNTGELLAEKRQILSVPKGKRGLSQSEMVYQHVRNLPSLIVDLPLGLQNKIKAIGVSGMPRRREDSYMPAFLVGKGLGEILASTHHADLYMFSHQENHVFAAMRSFPKLWRQPFYMLHLSGGTTDFLSIQWSDTCLEIKELASSSDISAGQIVDRIGVLLGLSFPCGPLLEQLAQKAEERQKYSLPLPRNPDIISFSGAETQLRRDFENKEINSSQAAFAVLDYIRKSLQRVLERQDWTKGTPFVAVGGVMANEYLRHHLKEDLLAASLVPFFAAPAYSSDNATGNAYAAFRMNNEINERSGSYNLS